MVIMTPEQRIDEALERVLNAAGSSLKNYMPKTISKMREEMLDIQKIEYIAGLDAAHRAIKQ